VVDSLDRHGDPLDMTLWHSVQQLTWPRKIPSRSPPFERCACQGPKRQPASWLYYLLRDDAELRIKVLPLLAKEPQ
jgi:hypothetical protein